MVSRIIITFPHCTSTIIALAFRYLSRRQFSCRTSHKNVAHKETSTFSISLKDCVMIPRRLPQKTIENNKSSIHRNVRITFEYNAEIFSTCRAQNGWDISKAADRYQWGVTSKHKTGELLIKCRGARARSDLFKLALRFAPTVFLLYSVTHLITTS